MEPRAPLKKIGEGYTSAPGGDPHVFGKYPIGFETVLGEEDIDGVNGIRSSAAGEYENQMQKLTVHIMWLPTLARR